MRRYYVPLVRRDKRHRVMMYFWLFLYMFVAIQMAWIMRPFIGNPNLGVSFFREGAWGNAYVEVARLIASALRSI